MAFFRRKEREPYKPPPLPPEDFVETVREATETAEQQYETARSREPEIEERHKKLSQIGKENALGPRFWQAVGIHKGSAP